MIYVTIISTNSVEVLFEPTMVRGVSKNINTTAVSYDKKLRLMIFSNKISTDH